jgi:hypothetical protein
VSRLVRCFGHATQEKGDHHTNTTREPCRPLPPIRPEQKPPKASNVGEADRNLAEGESSQPSAKPAGRLELATGPVSDSIGR